MTQPGHATSAEFMRSACSASGEFLTTDEAIAWLGAIQTRQQMVVRQIDFAALDQWSFRPDDGDLVHSSGKFFRIRGVHVSTNLGSMRKWDQPIIDQPEIGILGILVREFHGVLHLLMQAKLEPGNPLGVQLVPTVQATRSNYTQVHHGSRPPYVDRFLEAPASSVLVDELQYEQGSAFLKKRNRNMVVRVTEDIETGPEFTWLTLGQVKALLNQPSLVSMDTRTVVACMPLGDPSQGRAAPGQQSAEVSKLEFADRVIRSIRGGRGRHADESISAWINELRKQFHLDVEHVGLSRISGWRKTAGSIEGESGRFFKIIAVDVESSSREVPHWSQPMIAPVERGLIAFVVSEIEGTLHVLVQGRAEPGSADTITVGPTVQYALSYDDPERPDRDSPFVRIATDSAAGRLVYSGVQSEEGGRFFRVENEYRIVEVDTGASLDLPPNFRWITFGQLQNLVHQGLLNVEGRSLLACINFC